MKNAQSLHAKPVTAGYFHVPGAAHSLGKGRTQATSIILKTATNAKRQHSAIGKLVKMCKESPVATTARGITAEVRRDRDRGHD